MGTKAAASTIIVHPSDEMYGADKVLLETIDALSPLDIEVWLPTDVVYPNAHLSRELGRRGIRHRFVDLPVLRRSYMTPFGLARIGVRFVRTLGVALRERPRNVYVNTAALAPFLIVSWVVGARSVIHIHENLAGMSGRILQAMMWPARLVVCVSSAVQSELISPIRRRSQVIYNGFEIEASTSDPDEARDVFLVASRWNAWKGHEPLLRAWAMAARPNSVLRILGGAPPSGDAVDVTGLVRRLEIDSSVEVIGEARDVGAYIRASHVVLVPSIAPDPLPTIAIEAMANGRCVMGSRIGGVPEIVAEGVTGVLCKPGDVEDWSNAICDLDISAAISMGRAGRERFESLFTRTSFARHLRLSVLQAWAKGA